MKITFHGGAQSVTGANYLVETGGVKFLVDCGMFQGSNEAEARNYEPFPYNPADITAVFLTHSHADHTGRLPKLYKDGFRGGLYATPPTLDMTEVALPDNLSLVSAAAQRLNHPPLYTIEDLDGLVSLGIPTNYAVPVVLAPDVTVILHDAGHILGSAFIEIQAEGKKVYFSGDLGNPPTPLLKPSEYPLDADYIIVESAYGDRVHEDRSQRKAKLQSIIKESVARGGTLMIPSFALERTQELLFELNNMVNAGEIPQVPMFMDSPLAIKMTEVYQKYPDYFNTEAHHIFETDNDLFNFPGLTITRTPEESKNINAVQGAKVIIAGSGMSSGGRILHHERRYLSDSNSAILFIGFQAQGTLGRRILDVSKLTEGDKTVRIFEESVPVRCHVEAIGGYSAHADQPMLLSWVAAGKTDKLKRVFTVQGEEDSATVLANTIKANLGVDALAPASDQVVEI